MTMQVAILHIQYSVFGGVSQGGVGVNIMHLGYGEGKMAGVCFLV